MNDEELHQIFVEIPETVVGEVAGKLHSIGAWMDGSTDQDNMVKIETRIPMSQVKAFEAWLVEITAGIGKCIDSA